MKPFSYFIITLTLLTNSIFAQEKGFIPISSTKVNRTSKAYKKIALVVGIKTYLNKENNLKNPINDADDITVELKKLGFEVVTKYDLSRVDFEREIDQFGRQLRFAEVGVFYYSGHGFQYNGENYLVPKDANLVMSSELQYSCVGLDRLFASMEGASNKVNVIFLDACRSNLKLNRNIKLQGFSVPDQPSGSLVVFATKAGKTASDNSIGRNGLFTAALLKHISKKDIGIREVIDLTAKEVIEKSNGLQEPSRFDMMTSNYPLSIKIVVPDIETDGKKDNLITKKQPIIRDSKTLKKHQDLITEGASFYNKKDLKSAFNKFVAANTIIPEDSVSALYAGITSSQLDDDFKAKIYFTKYIENGGKDVAVFYSLAMIYKKEGDYNTAITILENGIKLNPNDKDLRNELVNLQLSAKKIDESIKSLEKLVYQNPENVTYMINLAILYDSVDEKELAISWYLKGLQKEPNNVDANYNVGVFYFNEAVEIKKKVDKMNLETYKKEGKELEDLACFTFKKSKPYFEKYNTLKPNDKDVKANLQSLYQVLEVCEKR